MLQKKDLEKKLEEIAQVLENKQMESPNLGVLAGISGVAMFFFYYAKYKQSSHHGEIGNLLLEECFNRINGGYNYPTYCAGIAGAGWVFEHLSKEAFIEIDTDELLPDFEDYLYQKMKQDIYAGQYDFLHGAIGYGLYFLKRFENTKSAKLKTKYTAHIQELIKGLEKMSEKDEHGIKWSSQMSTSGNSRTIYNLGLSHGISSIVNFLARAGEFRVFRTLGLPLLKGSVSYLLAQEQILGSSLFPSSISKNPDDEAIPTRLAWCYGDLGVGVSLYKAGRVLNEDKLKEHAIRILDYTTNRKGLHECEVVDASPCHGAFGIAHIYEVIFKATDNIKFKESSEYWMQEGLSLAIHKDGYAGYKQDRIGKPATNETNVLEGIAGIGLVLISFLGDFETNWGESLLIN